MNWPNSNLLLWTKSWSAGAGRLNRNSSGVDDCGSNRGVEIRIETSSFFIVWGDLISIFLFQVQQIKTPKIKTNHTSDRLFPPEIKLLDFVTKSNAAGNHQIEREKQSRKMWKDRNQNRTEEEEKEEQSPTYIDHEATLLRYLRRFRYPCWKDPRNSGLQNEIADIEGTRASYEQIHPPNRTKEGAKKGQK